MNDELNIGADNKPLESTAEVKGDVAIDQLGSYICALITNVSDPVARMRLIRSAAPFIVDLSLAIGLVGETDVPVKELVRLNIDYMEDRIKELRKIYDVFQKGKNAVNN